MRKRAVLNQSRRKGHYLRVLRATAEGRGPSSPWRTKKPSVWEFSLVLSNYVDIQRRAKRQIVRLHSRLELTWSGLIGVFSAQRLTYYSKQYLFPSSRKAIYRALRCRPRLAINRCLNRKQPPTFRPFSPDIRELLSVPVLAILIDDINRWIYGQ